MYILNKTRLKETFKRDYADLSNKLHYKNLTVFRSDRGNNILDDGVMICPPGIRKRLDKYGYKDMYYTVDEHMFINAMIGGKWIMINDAARVVVGLMLKEFEKKNPRLSWTVDQIIEISPVPIRRDAVIGVFEGKDKRYFIKEPATETDLNKCTFSLDIGALTQSCKYY